MTEEMKAIQHNDTDSDDGSFDDHVAMINQYIINYNIIRNMIAPVLFRNPSTRTINNRIDWAVLKADFKNEGDFTTTYRMSRASLARKATINYYA